MSRRCMTVPVTLASVLVASLAQGDVFNMPAAQTSLAIVPVGDLGNPADPGIGFDCGSVAYKFHMGKFDVTKAQYCQFLSAKAASSDPYELWNADMSSSAEGGIRRSGRNHSYTYTVKPGQENQPVACVTWYNAIRFANWLTNGQGSGDTESGAYKVTGRAPDWTVAVPDAAQRAAWAAAGKRHWILPSEDEWYKTAYYRGGGADAGYWTIPTQSNMGPHADRPPGGSNSANCRSPQTGYGVTASLGFDPRQNYLTDVGAYPGSLSAYGTLDQGGNVSQWTDTRMGASYVLRGGSWVEGPIAMLSASRYGNPPACEHEFVGFRVASVP